MEERKIKQIVCSVACFLLSFGLALLASWLLRNGPSWYGFVVFFWSFAVVVGLWALTAYFAWKAFGKDKS